MIRWTMPLLLAVVVMGCKKESGDGGSAGPGTQPSAAGTRPTEAKLDVPFTGTIKARYEGAKVFTADVTYTIGVRKIRREVAATDVLSTATTRVLTRLTPLEAALAGVIVDLDQGEAILYRREFDKRHFVRLPLAEYERMLAGVRYTKTMPTDCGYSTHFAELPRDRKLNAVDRPGVASEGGLALDELTIDEGRRVIVVYQCRQLVVDRRLVELVEANLPKEIVGFPCHVRWADRGSRLVTTGPADGGGGGSQSSSAVWRAVGQGLRAVDRATDTLREVKVVLNHWVQGPVPDAAFAVPAGYNEVQGLDAFEALFHHNDGGGWDD